VIIAQEVAEIIALASKNYHQDYPSVELKDEVSVFTFRLLTSPLGLCVVLPSY
jgi:hypothetical protein